MASGVRLLTVCLVCCAGLAVSPAVGLAAGSSSGGSESLSSSPLAVPAADGPTATPEASNGETPAIAVEGPGSDGTTPFGTTPFGATPFAPPPEGKTGCQTFGIRAPTFTYNGELMNLPFEGYITCNAAFAQTGQAVLKNASGTIVASGTAYNETTEDASSTGDGTSLRPGDYTIVYTLTVTTTTEWEPPKEGCTVNGKVLSCTATDSFSLRPPVTIPTERLGPSNPGSKVEHSCTGDPINCATGNLTETQTDLSVGGRGPGLRMVRSYNSLAAVEAKEAGPFGYGWTGTYGAHLAFDTETDAITVAQDNGSDVVFILNQATNEYVAAAWVQATLKKEGSNYIYTLPDQTKLEFNSEGRLTKETDRNGNAITLAYNSEKRLETATDGAGRKLKFKYNSGGQVESITDPMGHIVKYAYERGNLVSVTLPGEETPRWQFEYNASHLLTILTDGRGNTTRNEYNASNQVSLQIDRLKRKRELKYTALESGSETKITEPNGSETVEKFNAAGEPTKITRAAGVSGLESTTEDEYNASLELVKVTDRNKHVTEYGYDSAGNRTSEKNADSDEKKMEIRQHA